MHPLALAILLLTLSYSVYYFLFYESKFWDRYLGSDTEQYGKVVLRRLAGFIIFLTPYFFDFNNVSTIGSRMELLPLLGLMFLFMLLVVLVNKYAARLPANLEQYPQIRKQHWRISDLVISAATWILYLIGYEYMFRGYLFSESLNYLDLPSAIAVNVALYMLVHIPKGYKETFGSIPMGIVLCILTYLSGSVWPAIVLHCTLALSNEWFSIYYQLHQRKSV
jgi:membrane protease YdiL (CAAX protease family)